MANFVLVHGAWHGGWCWQRVTAALQRGGHRVHAVTLTGLGERAHLLSPAITLDTHIDDVINLIEAEELRRRGAGGAFLRRHDRHGGGRPAGPAPQAPGVCRCGRAQARRKLEQHAVRRHAAAAPGRRRRRPRISAFRRPTPRCLACRTTTTTGSSAARRRTPATPTRRRWTLTCSASPPCRAPSSAAPSRRWRRLTPSRLRAKDPKFWDGAWLPGASIVELQTGHDPMVSEPAALARILLGCGA